MAWSAVSLHKFGIRAKLATANLTYKFIKLQAIAILRDLAFAKVYEVIHIDEIVAYFMSSCLSFVITSLLSLSAYPLKFCANVSKGELLAFISSGYILVQMQITQ